MNFENKNGMMAPTEDLHIIIRDKDFLIPKDEIWGAKSNGNVIPVIRHRFILALKDIFGIKFQVPYPVDKWITPESSNSFRAYLFVYTESGTFGDGEVYVPKSSDLEVKYALTIALKRAEDRAIMKELGLYQQGLYSEVEFLTESAPVKEMPEVDISIKRASLFQELNKICLDKGISKEDIETVVSANFHKNKSQLSLEELESLKNML